MLELILLLLNALLGLGEVAEAPPPPQTRDLEVPSGESSEERAPDEGHDEPTAYEAVDAEYNAEADEPAPEPEPEPARSVWDDLADCESGNWVDGGASFETGSARWYWGRPGTEVPPWGTTVHDGGLQFHPDTWTWLAPEGFPERAYDATREQQIVVGEAVLDAQGWAAWPVCSKKLGLR